jgi:hypothetical protein
MTRVIPRTVPMGGTVSNELLIDQGWALGIVQPPALDGASFYVEGSWDNGATWGRVVESDGSVGLFALTANGICNEFLSGPCLLRIGTTAAQVTAARVFRWIVKE